MDPLTEPGSGNLSHRQAVGEGVLGLRMLSR